MSWMGPAESISGWRLANELNISDLSYEVLWQKIEAQIIREGRMP